MFWPVSYYDLEQNMDQTISEILKYQKSLVELHSKCSFFLLWPSSRTTGSTQRTLPYTEHESAIPNKIGGIFQKEKGERTLF